MTQHLRSLSVSFIYPKELHGCPGQSYSHDELHLNASHVEGSHWAALDGAVDT